MIPNELWAVFDMRVRIQPGWNSSDVEQFLEEVVASARLGRDDDPSNVVELTVLSNNFNYGETIADDTNPWWTSIQDICGEL